MGTFNTASVAASHNGSRFGEGDLMSLLVRFDCGCIGFATPIADDDEKERHVVILPCDDDEYHLEYTAIRRIMSGKTMIPIEGGRELELIQGLAYALDDGYKYRRIRKLLGISVS